jgi:IS30 family transposase
MSYHHLNSRDRYVIHHLVLHGLSYRKIGRQLERHHSTIQREVERNGPRYGGVYSHVSAEKAARSRFDKARHRRRFGHHPLRDYVFIHLKLNWSPEQISQRLKLDYPGHKNMRVSPECIYQWVYGVAGQDGDLHRHLRRSHKRRRRQRRAGAGRGLIPGRVSIHERARIVEHRHRFGDWEGDLVEGKRGSGNLVSLVDRKSRYLLARLLPTKHAGPTAGAITALLQTMPQAWRRTLTLDNGKEFSDFKKVETRLKMQVYFADPYAAWQRGCNENTNGLIRQYLPKGIDMKTVSPQRLAWAVKQINNRPRKCLNFKTPEEVLILEISGALET